MALDFAAMLAHERRKRKEQAQKQDVMGKGLQSRHPQLSWTDEDILAKQPRQLTGTPGHLGYLGEFLNADEASALEKAILTEHSNAEWLTLPKRRLLNLGGVPHPDGMIAESLPDWLQPLLAKLSQVGAFPEGIVPDQVLLNRYGVDDGIDPHADGPLFEPHVAIVSLQSAALLQLFEPPDNSPYSSEKPSDGAQSPGNGTQDKREKSTRLAASWENLGPAVATVLLQPRSLFTFAGDAYTDYLHGIATPEVARAQGSQYLDNRCRNLEETAPKVALGDEVLPGTRMSLTIRAVRKVAIPPGEFLTTAQREEAQRRRDWWARAVSKRNT